MKRIEKNGWGQVAPCCFPDPVNLRSRRTPADGVATKTPLCIIRRASVSSTPSFLTSIEKNPFFQVLCLKVSRKNKKKLSKFNSKFQSLPAEFATEILLPLDTFSQLRVIRLGSISGKEFSDQ
jgi:hypothetical protein